MAGAGALALGGEAGGAGLVQPGEETASEAEQQPASSQRARARGFVGGHGRRMSYNSHELKWGKI